jgi:NitT/TauT family transport system substrate-binding protein
MRTFIVKMLATVAAIALIQAVAPPVGAQQFKISIIEATPAFHSLPVTVLMRVGEADYNLKVESLQVTGGSQAGPIFIGGHGDIMTAGINTPAELIAKNMSDVKVIGVILHSMNWALVASTKSNIKTLADLKGKNVGISAPGSSSDTIVHWGFNKAGINADKDVSLIALGSVANLYAGIENDRIQAGVLVKPFLDKAIDSGIARIVGDWEALPWAGLVSIARTKDLKQNPEKFNRYQSAMKDVIRRLKTDRAFALKQAKLSYPNSSDKDLSEQLDFAIKVYWSGNGDMTQALYNASKDVLVGSGFMSNAKMPNFESLVAVMPVK